MIGFDRLSQAVAIAVTAALVAGGALPVLDARSAAAPDDAWTPLTIEEQAEDQPIEQVGEGDAGDAETLDQGAPPAQQPSGDVETLDEGAPPAVAPAVTESAAPVVEPAAAPATATDGGAVYTAPAPATTRGPVLPPGFGTGLVRVSAGRFGFPVGLNDCHVGAVTGRAYVGINCGDEERDVVGHAPSFEDFPFVLEAEFPFESDDAFFSDPFFTQRGDSVSEDDVVVSTASPRRDNSAEAENVVATGDGAVDLTQRTREREPRVRTGQGGARQQDKQQKAKKNGGNENTYVTSSNDGSVSSASKGKKRSQDLKQSTKGNKQKKDKGKKAKKSEKKRDMRRANK